MRTTIGVWVLVLLAACQKQSPPPTPEKNPMVAIETSMGSIELELYADRAPLTVKNFLTYVDAKFYDGTIFHRVIDGFMIQGGGFDRDLVQKKTEAPIRNEADNGLRNVRGTIAMARTQDPHSATAQFYINVVDNPALDHTSESFGYCVFGRATSGMDVVDKIKAVKVGNLKGMGDVPAEPVVITSIRRK